MGIYKQLAEDITKALVNNPSEISIEELSGAMTTVLTIKAADGDFGKVIGKNGNTISAIRSILSAIAAKNEQRIRVQVITPNGNGGAKKEKKAKS